MEKIRNKIRKLHSALESIPTYQSDEACGADVCAFWDGSSGSIALKPNERMLIPTGLSFEIPKGYEIQVRPRSGLAVKSGITILNSPGTIDSDYRGELQLIVINLSDKEFIIKNGDRLAQLVVAPVIRAEFIESQELAVSNRGSAGFGSTGLDKNI